MQIFNQKHTTRLIIEYRCIIFTRKSVSKQKKNTQHHSKINRSTLNLKHYIIQCYFFTGHNQIYNINHSNRI